MSKSIIFVSAFSNTSGRMIFSKSFDVNAEIKLVENYHKENTRLIVTESKETVFTFDFNDQQVSIIVDYDH